MEVLIIAAIIGLLPAFIAQQKGRSFIAWWAYGALLFIVALPHALIMSARPEDMERREANAGNKKCPHCAEWIKAEANVCRHCGRDVSPS
jgi:hypothetical protein